MSNNLSDEDPDMVEQALNLTANDILERRAILTLNQRQVADGIGLTQANYMRIERGYANPRRSTLIRIHQYFLKEEKMRGLRWRKQDTENKQGHKQGPGN